MPEGLWVKCPDCSQVIYNKDLATNLNVCPKCAHHFRIGALERLRTLFDDGVWVEHLQRAGLIRPTPVHGHQAVQGTAGGVEGCDRP